MVYWKVPFSEENLPELLEAIEQTEVSYPSEPQISQNLKDLFSKILEKSPQKRITMEELKHHPFLTEKFGEMDKQPEMVEVT